MSNTRLVNAARMVSICGSFCRISRDTFKDRSLESTTPLIKRRYRGKNCSASSIIKVRCTYSLTPRERSEEHTSELQSRGHLVCRLLLEKKNIIGDRAQGLGVES